MSANHVNTLLSCAELLSSSSTLLNQSISNLNKNVAPDFERLPVILSQTRVFDLVSESSIREARSELESEFQPLIVELISRAEQEISRLRLRKNTLLKRAELLQVRIDAANNASFSSKVLSRGLSNATPIKGDYTEEQLKQLQALRNKKERLKYSLSRHELEEKHKRISMAPPPDRF